MPLCPRTPVSDYMCWHFAGGKAFASRMWKRKDVNTWTWVLLIAFQCVDLKLTTKGSPLAFAICLPKHREFQVFLKTHFIFWCKVSRKRRWGEHMENIFDRTPKGWEICIDSDGLNSRGPWVRAGKILQDSLRFFSKVIYMWLLTIEKEQKCHQSNNIYCKSEVRRSLGLMTEFK